jgi:hypothetical protein
MSWLAVDGYGFDKAYFHTRKYVDEQRLLPPYPWDGHPGYFPRAVDQGIGRALWFIHGGNAPAVTTAVQRFATERHADLYSGVGLAATFAGGCDATALAALARDAGPHRSHLAQGAVFAAKARAFSGFVPPHSETAISTLAGMSVTAASALADDVALDTLTHASEPAYEMWRQQVRAHFVKIPGRVG